MERLYKGFDIITNRVHTSNQQRQIFHAQDAETQQSVFCVFVLSVV